MDGLIHVYSMYIVYYSVCLSYVTYMQGNVRGLVMFTIMLLDGVRMMTKLSGTN